MAITTTMGGLGDVYVFHPITVSRLPIGCWITPNHRCFTCRSDIIFTIVAIIAYDCIRLHTIAQPTSYSCLLVHIDVMSWQIVLVIIFINAAVSAVHAYEAEYGKRTNVLFIIYDDLRPLFNAYGEKHMITPNFDRLASKSVLFDSAHCQVCRIVVNEFMFDDFMIKTGRGLQPIKK